jgi:hypothetical protein
MYMGGNGFYWVTPMDPSGRYIELRRRDGTEHWQGAPGESYHTITGEPGGLWRFRGLPPQKYFGVGFTAQGFDKNSPYKRMPGSFDRRAAFIFEGIGANEIIGDFPSLVLEEGAAGSELDRLDYTLGTPPHTLLLAQSFGHSDAYQHVVEEVNTSDSGKAARSISSCTPTWCSSNTERWRGVLDRRHRVRGQPLLQQLHEQRVAHHRERPATFRGGCADSAAFGRAIHSDAGREPTMTLMLRRLFFAASLLLALSTPAFAQDVLISGTVVDESKGVLPGVTVTAMDVSSGRTFDTLTDERGEYRLRIAAGTYNLKAEMSGFAVVEHSKLEFLVGQNATLPITLKVASLEENVTVMSQSPLVDLRSAQISGNVDPRQMEAIPIAGRDWLSLSANVAGMNANSFAFGKFNLQLDGQSITQETSVTSFGQPGISRDAIAEYQVITSPYDVSQGRTVGLEVQAISKSGANNLSGSAYGYFRDDAFNTADPFTDTVLPFAQQQYGGTFGGPIVQNKTHYFGAYERERNPNTLNVHPSALAPWSRRRHRDDKVSILGRVDHQISNRDHFVVRGNCTTGRSRTTSARRRCRRDDGAGQPRDQKDITSTSSPAAGRTPAAPYAAETAGRPQYATTGPRPCR